MFANYNSCVDQIDRVSSRAKTILEEAELIVYDSSFINLIVIYLLASPIVIIAIAFIAEGEFDAFDLSEFCDIIGKNSKEWVELYIKMN